MKPIMLLWTHKMLNEGKTERAIKHIICFARWITNVTEKRKTHFLSRLLCPLVRNSLYCLKLQIGNVYSALQVEMHWNIAVIQSEAQGGCTLLTSPSGCCHSEMRSLRDEKLNLGHTSPSFALLIKLIDEFLHLCPLPGFPLFFRVLIFLKESFEHTMM